MLLTHYYALAGAGVLLAAAWLMVPRARVEVTSFLSLLVWLLLGLVGNQTETVVQNEGGHIETTRETAEPALSRCAA